MKTPRQQVWRRLAFALIALLVVGAVVLGRPTFHLLRVALRDRDEIPPIPAGRVNDASRLNETPVIEVWKIPTNSIAAEAQLAELLQRAREKDLKISIAGVRHSMGGHTICSNGIVIDMLPFRGMELRASNSLLHVQAGARWNEIIPFVNSNGLSIEVMQSYSDFTVGGSLSVNCHGWQYDRPPIASTVAGFRLMLADGKIVHCSRSENEELFSLALGGYGLFGIILDADLRLVPNRHYRIERTTVPTTAYVSTIEKLTSGGDVDMVYGRLRVTPDQFLQEGIINLLHRTPATSPLITQFEAQRTSGLNRLVLRGSAGSDYGKQLRWDMEKTWHPRLAGSEFDRNQLLLEDWTPFQEHRPSRTDILMECFISPAQFEPFLAELRQIIPTNQVDLLNITVRHINPDRDTFLRFAHQKVYSLVLLFNQACTPAGDQDLARAAREIIAAALRHDGKYYLPYRLHASPEQLATAYPQVGQFFRLKRKYDPEELFQNEFYRHYGHASYE